MYLDLMKRMFKRSIITTLYFFGLAILLFGVTLYSLIRLGNVSVFSNAYFFALTVNNPIILATALSILAISLFVDDKNSGLIEYLLASSGYMKEKIIANYIIAVTIPSVILEGIESFVLAILINNITYFLLSLINSLGLTWLIFSVTLYINYLQRTPASSRIILGGYIGLILFFLYQYVLSYYVRLADLILTAGGLSMFISSIFLLLFITRNLNTEKLLPP